MLEYFGMKCRDSGPQSEDGVAAILDILNGAPVENAPYTNGNWPSSLCEAGKSSGIPADTRFGEKMLKSVGGPLIV